MNASSKSNHNSTRLPAKSCVMCHKTIEEIGGIILVAQVWFSICGEPINYPMGSEMLFDSGCKSYAPIHPFDPSCINKKCKKYREWNDL